jgi:hypothetical protein
MQIKVEKMKSLKIKPRKAKRDDWKRNRKVQVRTKRIMQEQNYG